MPEGKSPENGQFVEGNTYWQESFKSFRFGIGREKVFETELELLKACEPYFAWAKENPLKEQRILSVDGQPKKVEVDVMRAITIKGMCNFLGICEKTWRNMRAERDELKEAIAFVEQMIFVDKLEGAAAGLLKEQIIMRELGMADATRIAGHDGGPVQIEVTHLNGLDRARFLAFAMREAIEMVEKNEEVTIDAA
jgi:hypothetical protein